MGRHTSMVARYPPPGTGQIVVSQELYHPDSKVEVRTVEVDEEMGGNVQSTVDIAVNESLTIETTLKILANPLTWLPALAYLTTFGLELVVDAQMANVLFALFGKQIKGFDQTKAGYYTSVLCVRASSFSVGKD